ncbi:hypothetical protein LZ198_29405 [Myxococcus sp. K15C18031901]|uniref:hypothetical protein n=1 Tax=Myxococcus dinghuensis TaxID=2906761 RepID=UPI0020A71699|nr:hypothetical protein [Myxococcus dinghuensis]MCP3103004.1 hypothetical protein [Myxococcus dinghuensis]
MATTTRRPTLEGPARTWSIAALLLMCVVLGSVLLYRPGPSVPHDRRAPSHPARAEPREAPGERPLSPEERRSMYRAWPMFEGWPLPQPPAGEQQPPDEGTPTEQGSQPTQRR